MIEHLLLASVHISTFDQQKLLTKASGFFFARNNKLFLVTSRHVLIDEPSKHFPNRIELEINNDPNNLANSTGFSIPLYVNQKKVWRQGVDSAGDIDVAVLEIEQNKLPATATYFAFTPDHMLDSSESISIGTEMLIVGFPLGFHDTLHHLPVARRAINASSFDLRFQGNGYFLTDARTHRGMSGAPVVSRKVSRRTSESPTTQSEESGENDEMPWTLLGIHSARLDVGTRDLELDEALGLNCAWFADILLTLTN